MNLATGLLALVLIGADGPGGPAQKGLRYDVRILEMPGVAWRGALHEALEPISHEGHVAAWTMPREASETLKKAASNEIATPRLTGLENTSAHIRLGHSQPFVSHITRIADGPVGHARSVAFMPTVGRAENSLKIQVRGRRLDQGVLAQVEIADTRVNQMLTYVYKEKIQSENGPPSLSTRVEVPEVSSSSAHGEWLVPTGDVLVVSLGLHTKADKEGKAQTVERLALVDVQTVDPAPVALRGLPEGLPPLPVGVSPLADKNCQGQNDGEVKHVLPSMPQIPESECPPFLAIDPDGRIVETDSLPSPPTPRRGLPTAINHKGEIVETKVPDAGPIPTTDDSGKPRPTPQSPVKTACSSEPDEPKNEDEHACRADGPGHSAPFRPGHVRIGESKNSDATAEAPSIRIEPRIHFEIHVRVPDLPASLLPGPGLVLNHLDKIAAIAPLMEKAAGSYLFADEDEGAIRVLDLAFPLGKAVKARVSVLVESEDAHQAKEDDSATRVRFDPESLPKVKKIKKDGPSCPACPSSKSDDDQAPEAPTAVKRLTLREAVRIGLRHADKYGFVVLEAGSMSSPTMIAPTEHQTLNGARGNALRLVRAIEQQYWDLAAAQAHCRVSDEFLSMAQGLKEKYRDSWSENETSEVDLAIKKIMHESAKAHAMLKYAERELRDLLGVPRSVPTLAAVTPPLTRKISPDWDAARNVMLTSNPEIRAHSSEGVVHDGHEACIEEEDCDDYGKELRKNLTHQLARYFLEVDGNYKLYQTAKGLKDAAMTRLKEQDAKFRNGEVPPERYLDSMNRWASAIAQEAEFLSRYNSALAALEEVKGTLLERDGVKVVAAKAVKKEKGVVRTSFKSDSNKGRVSLSFVFGQVWRGPLATTDPAYIRIPLGPAFAVGLGVPLTEKQRHNKEVLSKICPPGSFTW